RRVGQYYNWTLDELQYAAKVGFDGVCTNEHHQNAYGFMPSPNLMGSVLARATNGIDVAIVQMGATLPTSNPPLPVAEEDAMLDCISGGRLVAGLPLGSPMDVNLCYGITPMEHRERYREAFALVMKAWQAREIFAGNGNPPHPPAAPAGVGARLGQHQHLRLRRGQRGLLLLPELLRRQVGQEHDGRLLERGDQEGSRRQSVSGGLSPARDGGRDGGEGGRVL